MPARYYKPKPKPSATSPTPSPIVGRGQWTPGALSAADTETTTQSVATPIKTNFVDLGGGKTGTLINQPAVQTDLNQFMTTAFAQKAAQVTPEQIALGNVATPILKGNSPAQNPQLMSMATPEQAGMKAGNVQETPPLMSEGGDRLSVEAQAKLDEKWYNPLTWTEFSQKNIYEAMTIMPTPIGMVGKGWTVGTLGKGALSAKNSVQVYSYVNKVLYYLKKPKVVAGIIAGLVVGAIGSYPFSGFLKEEALQTTAMTWKTAHENNDVMGMNDATTMTDEILDESVEEAVIQGIPYANVVKRVKDNFAAARLQNEVQKRITQNEINAQQNGTSPISEYLKDKEATEKRITDYYNSERLRVESEIAAARAKASGEEREAERKTAQEIADARAKSNEAERAADRKAAQENAAFWLEYRRKLAEMEKKQQEESAKFWLEYRKMILKLQEETGRSRLSFGLLR